MSKYRASVKLCCARFTAFLGGRCLPTVARTLCPSDISLLSRESPSFTPCKGENLTLDPVCCGCAAFFILYFIAALLYFFQRRFVAQSELIGYQCDKLGICGFAFARIDGIAEERVKGINIAPVPCYFYCMAYGSLHP